MKVSVKNLDETRVILTVELAEKELMAAKLVATHKLAKKTKVPGFRLGKAPDSVAVKHIDPVRLEEQSLDEALSKAVAEGFIENKLQALERPTVEIIKYIPGSLLEFTAEADVFPVIKLADYKNLKVKRAEVKISEPEVDAALKRFCDSQAKLTEVKRAAKLGDEVVIDFVGSKDNIPFRGGTAENHPLRLGSASFIAGFEEAIVGKSAGDKFDISLVFPEDYPSADLKGKPVKFEITVKKISSVKLPKLDDKFATKAGPYKSLNDLKTEIRNELLKQSQGRELSEFKDNLLAKLVDKSIIPVPKVLLADQLKSLEQDVSQNLAYQGNNLATYIKEANFSSIDEWREKELSPQASKRVKAGLALAELGRVEKVSISESDVNETIENLKAQYSKGHHMIEEFAKPAIRQDIASRLLTDKTIERLVELNTK